MPLPRILLFATVALLLMLGALWAMDVNFTVWLGAWLSPEKAVPVGSAIVITCGTVLAYVYAHYVGNKFTGPGVVRGLVFGAVFGAFAIWALPPILSGLAGAVGDTQTVYQGRGITNSELRADENGRLTYQPASPPIFGVEPPLRFMTENHQWAAADAWQGRLLPFGVAFLLWGALIGTFLSEQVGPKKQ